VKPLPHPPKQAEMCEWILMGYGQTAIGFAMKTSATNVKRMMIAVSRRLRMQQNIVLLALAIHDNRKALGVRCQACGER
jgi:hypothetical protein